MLATVAIATPLVLGSAMTMLAGCGQKGALTLPKPAGTASAPAR